MPLNHSGSSRQRPFSCRWAGARGSSSRLLQPRSFRAGRRKITAPRRPLPGVSLPPPCLCRPPPPPPQLSQQQQQQQPPLPPRRANEWLHKRRKKQRQRKSASTRVFTNGTACVCTGGMFGGRASHQQKRGAGNKRRDAPPHNFESRSRGPTRSFPHPVAPRLAPAAAGTLRSSWRAFAGGQPQQQQPRRPRHRRRRVDGESGSAETRHIESTWREQLDAASQQVRRTRSLPHRERGHARRGPPTHARVLWGEEEDGSERSPSAFLAIVVHVASGHTSRATTTRASKPREGA